jgi:hypothetical protein
MRVILEVWAVQLPWPCADSTPADDSIQLVGMLIV